MSRKYKDIFEKNEQLIDNIYDMEDDISDLCEENEELNAENNELHEDNTMLGERVDKMSEGIKELHRDTRRFRPRRRYIEDRQYEEKIINNRVVNQVDCPFVEKEGNKETFNNVNVSFKMDKKGKIKLYFAIIVISLLVLGCGFSPDQGWITFEVLTEAWVNLVFNPFNVFIYVTSGFALTKLYKLINKK